jgi:cytochrome P450
LWFFTKHKDVNAILRDRRFGRSIDHILSPQERGVSPDPPEYEPFTRLHRHRFFDMEPPEHTRLRNLVHKVFTPRRIEQLRPRIKGVAENLLNVVAQQGGMDLIEDFAMPLPVIVIAELLGIPESDRHRLRPWSHAIVAMYELNHTVEETALAIQASQEFSDYIRFLGAERRKHPQDDLITALVQVEERGDVLTENELVATCVFLLNAGHEATVNGIGNGILALFRHPAQFQLLKRDMSILLAAIEEMLRFDAPLQMFQRWVLEDMQYGDIKLELGDEVGLILGAANRDPRAFTEPHRFDLRRASNHHLSFGAGIHYCLGAPLARLEMTVALQTLFARFPKLALAEREPRFRSKWVIRGLESLRVSF